MTEFKNPYYTGYKPIDDVLLRLYECESKLERMQYHDYGKRILKGSKLDREFSDLYVLVQNKLEEYRTMNTFYLPKDDAVVKELEKGTLLLELSYECEVCHNITEGRFSVHSTADNSSKGFRFICCTCLGHESLSCCK